MTTEEIKVIVDDERVDQLVSLMCHHWEVATHRLEELTEERETGIDTCIEAEVYGIMMRMQSAVMALVELNKKPCAYLFSEYMDRISHSMSNTSMRRSIWQLIEHLQDFPPANHRSDFFDFMTQSFAQHMALPEGEQKANEQKLSPQQYIMTYCAQYMNPNDLMMFVNVIQQMHSQGDTTAPEKTADFLQSMRETMSGLSAEMAGSMQKMLINMLILMLLPDMIVKMIQQSRSDSKKMAKLFNNILERVRESCEWWEYWKDRRETLKVVSDSISWNEIMKAERTKERELLGKIPGGLFAKWTTDRKAFDEYFVDVHLNDDEMRSFIFHLVTLYEISRELEPMTKYDNEQLVNNDLSQVGDAVLEAAHKLDNLVADAWFPYYDNMWQELIANETIFELLKVTRRSPHNNLFTARFFCHLVGEMKKSAVFGGHSDNDLAMKLATSRYVGTFRKNIQERMDKETGIVKKNFNSILLKYSKLVQKKQ